MYELLIEFAIDADGEMVYPDTKHDKPVYCSVCKGELIHRQGEKKQWHFAHKSKTGCRGESILHYGCKKGLASNLLFYAGSDTLEQVGWLDICYQCENHSVCNKDLESGKFRFVWGEGFKFDRYDDVAIEYRLPDSNYRADIALFKESNLVGIIEIRHTHKVEKEKWEYLASKGIPCLEISADEMKKFAPNLMLVVLKNNIHDVQPNRKGLHNQICEECIEKKREYRRERKRWLKRLVDPNYLTPKLEAPNHWTQDWTRYESQND